MAIGRSLRASLASITPTWLQNAPGLRNLYATLWTVSLLGDCLREVAWEGMLAAYPGVGTPTANPLIGQSRGLTQGPAEPDATFAARCINWLPGWSRAGSLQSLAQEIQAFLVGYGTLGAGVYPVVRAIDRAGNAVTANADRSLTFADIAWNWDETAGYVDGTGYIAPATLAGWWSDVWIVVQDMTTHWSGFGDLAWLSAWNTGDQTIDGRVPQAVVQGILSIVGARKGAHNYVRAIVFTSNVAAYDPGGVSGNDSHNVGGAQIAARSGANAYWTPPAGA